MARPSKLTPEVQDRACQLIKVGNTVEVAAQACGISEATFHSWMARGEREPGAHREFRDAVEVARAEAEATLVTRVAKAAANGSWPAAGWLLERRYPERWSKVAERKRAADDAGPAEQDSLAKLDDLAARRAARG